MAEYMIGKASVGLVDNVDFDFFMHKLQWKVGERVRHLGKDYVVTYIKVLRGEVYVYGKSSEDGVSRLLRKYDGVPYFANYNEEGDTT